MSRGEKRSAPKGMPDVLPPDIYIWQKIEAYARDIFSVYGFKEIRPPVVESTDIFRRSIGENTDIVEKEMYTFTDKGGRSLTLRPEGTASVVRCYVENHLSDQSYPQKYYYLGPMFRYERPQAGRFRQFYQIGVEAFGSANPVMDAEVLSMLRHFLAGLGLGGLKFQVNSIGCEKCRPGYRESLLDFFSDKLNGLCPDCVRRYHLNPLRILDCKVSRCVELRAGSPRVTDSLCDDCSGHFDELKSLLDVLDIPYIVNPDMVRGLDYYTRTTFEVISEGLGAQNAVAAGGRYDRLVKEFGGAETPAIGFAVGMERIAGLMKKSGGHEVPAPAVFIANIGEAAVREGILIADRLRGKGLWAELGEAGASLRSQMRRADRLTAEYVFIIGEEELKSGKLKWKKLSDSSQGEILLSGISDFLLKKQR
ncbi:MAG: histidine--tRNA ligase [Nitrospirota bacterium]|nr:histidine--tRNA ligase [Nitrospirota bacterium]